MDRTKTELGVMQMIALTSLSLHLRAATKSIDHAESILGLMNEARVGEHFVETRKLLAKHRVSLDEISRGVSSYVERKLNDLDKELDNTGVH